MPFVKVELRQLFLATLLHLRFILLVHSFSVAAFVSLSLSLSRWRSPFAECQLVPRACAINSESFSGGYLSESLRKRDENTMRDVSVHFNLRAESSSISDEAFSVRSVLKAPLKRSIPTMGSAIGD